MALQVTRVNLPERTRARFEAEGNQQRVLKPHDIRIAIPLVDYTNPAKFPPYLFREYPKMPLLTGNRPIVIDESGGVLVFYDAADETDFKALNPELADEIEANAPTKALADQIASRDAENEDLRARLRAAGLDDGTKKKPANALADVTRPSASLAVKPNREVPEPAPESMSEQIKQAEAAQTGGSKPKGNPLRNKKN